jgi:general secretion pathway protein I
MRIAMRIGVRTGVSHLHCRHRTRAGGFTLIEVLVAMTILAVGVSALVISAGASAQRAEHLRTREVARWVASNTMAEWQAVPGWPEIGTTNTEVEMVGQRWFVRTRTQKVADADLRRLDIEVRAVRDADSYLYSVKGFVGNPEFRL